MKRIIHIGCIILGLFFASQASVFAQVDDEIDTEIGNSIDVGVGLAYGSQIESLGITADAYYRLNERFRVGGGLTYFFPEDNPGANVNWFSIDLNGQYLFYSQDEMHIYGLAGLNILIVSVNFDSDQFEDSSESEIGLNIGGGIEYEMSFADLFGELKIAGVGGDADQLVLSAGLRFDL